MSLAELSLLMSHPATQQISNRYGAGTGATPWPCGQPISLVVGLIDELRIRFPDLDENLVSDVVLGVVSPNGDQGAAIARTVVLAAGLPDTTGGVQLNRFCGSGLEAVNPAAQKVRSGWDDLVIAGGVESMSRVPMASDGVPGHWIRRRTSPCRSTSGHRRRPNRQRVGLTTSTADFRCDREVRGLAPAVTGTQRLARPLTTAASRWPPL
jgi:hypothetical protein